MKKISGEVIKLKKRIALLGIMLIVTGISAVITKGTRNVEYNKKETIQIVTSFYPMYIAALNITDGIDHVMLTNLTENKGGCLHDYQLTTEDMKKLEYADILITNGAGMEAFMDSILKNNSHISVIDASSQIDLIKNLEPHGHEKEHGHEEHEHGAWNGHVWMDPVKYQQQIDTISEQLQELDKNNAKQYAENAAIYKKKIQNLEKEIEGLKENHLKENIIIFHDAFAYLADRLGMKVVHQIDMDNDTAFSAGEIAEIMDEIKENNVTALLVEKQFSTAVPERIAKETGTRVVIINSLVSGKMDENAYINGMKENIKVIKQELSK